MIDRSKQIISDPEAIARCLDPNMLLLLGSHSTFTINELYQQIDPSLDKLLSKEKLNIIFDKINPSNFDLSKITRDINEAIKPLVLSLSKNQIEIMYEKIRIDPRYGSKDFIKTIFLETTVKSVASILVDGTSISLLQPGSKGWQKGKLKLCFEFVPEEPEFLTTATDLIETKLSPLDEIRQLSNELTSMVSIEQN